MKLSLLNVYKYSYFVTMKKNYVPIKTIKLYTHIHLHLEMLKNSYKKEKNITIAAMIPLGQLCIEPGEASPCSRLALSFMMGIKRKCITVPSNIIRTFKSPSKPQKSFTPPWVNIILEGSLSDLYTSLKFHHKKRQSLMTLSFYINSLFFHPLSVEDTFFINTLICVSTKVVTLSL